MIGCNRARESCCHGDAHTGVYTLHQRIGYGNSSKEIAKESFSEIDTIEGCGHLWGFVGNKEELIFSCGEWNFFSEIGEVCQRVNGIVYHVTIAFETDDESNLIDAVFIVGIVAVDGLSRLSASVESDHSSHSTTSCNWLFFLVTTIAAHHGKDGEQQQQRETTDFTECHTLK